MKEDNPFNSVDGFQFSGEDNPFDAKAKVEKPTEEPVTEPKKVTKKSTPTPKDVDEDLSAIVADWDD